MRTERKTARIQKGYDYSAADARILKMGRYEEDEESILTTWSGFTLKFSFAGTGCEIGIRGSGIYFDVFVDGERSQLVTHAGKEKYTIAAGLKDSVHDVIVARRSHCLNGQSRFVGISSCRSRKFELVRPFYSPALHLEITGDSIAAGCNAEMKKDQQPMPEYDNGYMAFGPVAARLLNAGWSNIGVGGRGLCRNWNEEKPYPGPHMNDYYDGAVYPMTGGYARNRQKAGIVIIELGTNDFGHEDPPSALMYAAVYSKLVRKALRRNKGAHVICMAPFLGGPEYLPCRNAIQAAAGSLSRRKVHYIDPVKENWFGAEAYGECFPDGVHPNLKGHELIAKKLAEFIKAKCLAEENG